MVAEQQEALRGILRYKYVQETPSRVAVQILFCVICEFLSFICSIRAFN